MGDTELREYIAFRKCIDDMQIQLDKRLCDLVAEASLTVTEASSKEEKILFNRRAFILQGELKCRNCEITEALRDFIEKKLAEGAEGYTVVKRVTDDPDSCEFMMTF